MKNLIIIVLLCFTSSTLAGTYSDSDVDQIIAKDVEPDGVVFELMSWDEDTWTWASPMLTDLSDQLRQKYPDLEIAVVSHGNEMFDLTKNNSQFHQPAVQQLAALSEDNVDIHVCGTFSGWRDIETDAYLDFIDVAPSGPAQINSYIQLGYEHIILRSPNGY